VIRVNLFQSFNRGVWITFGYILLLYGTLSETPKFISWLSEKDILGHFIAAPFVISIPLLLYVSVKAGRYGNISFWLSSIFLCLVFLSIIDSVSAPAEILHIALYAVLGIFLFAVLRFKLNGLRLFISVAVLTTLFGILDEGIQFMLPNRYFDMNDILINSVGGLMALIVIRYIFGDRGL